MSLCFIKTEKQQGETCPDLVLLPQQSHEAVVLFAGARRDRGCAGASQGVVVLTDRSTGNLSEKAQIQML